MYENETYKKAFDMIGSKTVITADSLEKRKSVQQKRRLQQAVYAFVAAAILFVGSNAVTYAMNGETWLSYAFNTRFGNGVEVAVEEYTSDEINDVSMISFELKGNDNIEYFTQEDGRLFFVFGDIKEDITDICTGDNFYDHEYYDENGSRHVIVVGCNNGEPECAEYIFNDNGYVFCMAPSIENSAQEDNVHLYLVNSPLNRDIRYEEGKPAWLANAEKALDLQ
ncbi:MAG: hypothetical protein K6G24_11900 [Lachnospiraceae bacterium]|nr:hypothetical protein [Lachnospiraceae bacterium]